MNGQIIARVVSVVLHPLLLATYLFGLFAFIFPIAFDPINEDRIGRFMFLLFCVTFVLPVLVISLLKTLGITPTFTMYRRQDRILPFILICGFYTAVTVVFYHRAEVSINDNFLKFLIVINALVIVATVVTLFYKVSVHTIGIWGFVGILLPLNNITETSVLFYPLVSTIVLAGIVMSARLQLQVHSLREVIIGSVLGLGTGFFMVSYLFRY
ncbi:MAG TPA: hypothetical protein VKZ68_08995 [Ohtaekwangia sp.]|nr:hypothetical protein [Ohtaekwangia sp.]